jgi:hypothetical protein
MAGDGGAFGILAGVEPTGGGVSITISGAESTGAGSGIGGGFGAWVEHAARASAETASARRIDPLACSSNLRIPCDLSHPVATLLFTQFGADFLCGRSVSWNMSNGCGGASFSPGGWTVDDLTLGR